MGINLVVREMRGMRGMREMREMRGMRGMREMRKQSQLKDFTGNCENWNGIFTLVQTRLIASVATHYSAL
ncbi:hypothetical protein FDUTEX481_07256 [Tolypothrix sp. PCC 7601]|nr:hypothetical protein FDUTEX481_07256 [Tolypothrix sp. PCC 7601]